MGLEVFLDAKSVAVVGASRTKGKVGYEIVAQLLAGGFEGPVYPVNPAADEVLGHKCHPDLGALPARPDLVVVVVPAQAVAAVMRQCAAVGVKAVIIISAGFREVGEAGRRLEEEVIAVARQASIRVIGPNCLGIMVPGRRLNASFGGELPRAGSIGYLSQSGALLAAILDMAKAQDIGFSMLLSIGNKADVDELDVVAAMGQHPATRVIAGYLESIGDGAAFLRQAEQISRSKPILLMKSGGTAAGAAAASSHTGSLAGGETAYEAVFDRAGVIRCESIKQQFDFAQAFAYQPLPAGPAVAVITNAGGPGIMAADAIERHGLVFAELAETTREKLAAALPPAANVRNPVDILGDALADRYQIALDVVLDDPNVQAVLVLLTPQAMTDATGAARAVLKVQASKRGGPDPDALASGAPTAKPVLACFLGGGKVAEAIGLLHAGQVPCYDSPESAVVALKAMADYVRWRNRPQRRVKLFAVNRRRVEQIIQRHLRRGQREIGEMEAKEVLQAYGFVTPRGALATSAEQAVAAADQIGYPVAMKIWSPDILHKSDVGGVKLNLASAQAVSDAFDLMMYRIPRLRPNATILGVLVQEMCARGQEVILGMSRDKRFGPLMMFGMGGTMVEVLQDVAFYLAPITGEEARQMLASTRTYKMLQGVRGQEGVDLDAVAEGLQRLSQLVTEFPQIQELDINPYVVGPRGVAPVAVDARISVEQAS